MNTQDLIKEGNSLFQKVDQRDTHLSQPYSLKDANGTREIIDSLTQLSSKIPEIEIPKSIEEVYVKELKRISLGGIQILNEQLSSSISEPNAVIDRYSVKVEDIERNKDWLLSNRERVIKANLNQYEKYSSIKKSEVPIGDPNLRHQAETLLLEHVEKIKNVLLSHKELHQHFSELFSNYHISIDSATHRSYSDRVGKAVLLSTPKFIFLSNAKLDVELHWLLSTFGHEVLGHAANFKFTDDSDMPFYIKWGFPTLISSTGESVAKFFENQIFTYLKDCTKLDELFTENHPLEDVYTCFEDTRYLAEYQAKAVRLGIWVLSQTKMDDTQKQIEEISKYSIETKWPADFVNMHRNDWNKATGLLLPKVVSELRYCVEVIKDLKSQSVYTKPDFDMKILKGMWTPQGMAEYMAVLSM